MESLVLAAALLGLTHAVEPDHVAGIAALAADAGRRRAALVGACFAAGHVALVLVWVVVGSVLLSRLPATGALDRFGGVVLGVALLAVGALTAHGGIRTLRGATGHGHVHGRLGLVAADGGDPGVREYLGLGLVGALFTLSPPLSMLALVTGVLPTASTLAVLPLVVAYALGIGLAMTVVGGIAGGTFDLLGGRRRVHAGAQLLASLVVTALGLFTLAGAA
jgi:hypothetical protein